MLVFCSVHVKHSFAVKYPKHPARYKINKIWYEDTVTSVIQRIDSISTLYPKLKSWINSKKADWILAGLTTEQSKVPYDWWTFARKHTGIGESSHFTDNNYSGRKISLLAAVLRSGIYLVYTKLMLTIGQTESPCPRDVCPEGYYGTARNRLDLA